MKIFLFSLLLSSTLAACTSEDLPHERVAFSLMASHGTVEIACAGDKRLTGLIGLVEYRKDQQKLFATTYDGHDKMVATMPIEKDEVCTFTPSTPGSVSSIDNPKYYQATHTWASRTKQNVPVCINMPQKRTCIEATAILEMKPRAGRNLGTQAVYVIMDNKIKALEAFVVPAAQAQDFPGFSEVPLS